MTIQFNDRVFRGKIELEITNVDGSGLFDPAALGFKVISRCSACWRGYVATYAILDHMLFLSRLWCVGLPDDLAQSAKAGDGPKFLGVAAIPESPCYSYNGLHVPMKFSGSLVLTTGLLREHDISIGFRPAWIYESVHEVHFDVGRLVSDHDRSSEAAKTRAKMIDEKRHPSACPSELAIGAEVTVQKLAKGLNLPVFLVSAELLGRNIWVRHETKVDFATASLICERFGVTPRKAPEKQWWQLW